jgi:preprotein translocase subunit SecF
MVTSLSIMLTLAILLVLGPEIIFGFTAAMLLGIVIGTFSSVYIAAPILVWANVSPNSFVPDDAVSKSTKATPAEGFLDR